MLNIFSLVVKWSFALLFIVMCFVLSKNRKNEGRLAFFTVQFYIGLLAYTALFSIIVDSIFSFCIAVLLLTYNLYMIFRKGGTYWNISHNDILVVILLYVMLLSFMFTI